MKNKFYRLGFAVLTLMLYGCDSFLDIDPPTNAMTDKQVFSTEQSIEIAATGLYTNNFLNNPIYYQMLEWYLGYTSDELLYNRTDMAEYFQNAYSSVSTYFSNLWRLPYTTIYQCNDFIANVENSTVISEEKKNVFLSEARFFRAYSYFLLVNSFGDVPLVLSNDYRETALLPRTNKSDVYLQIQEDLEWAESKLQGLEISQTKISSEAVKALLARIYLYTEQWLKASEKASELIPIEDGGTGEKFRLEQVDKVFKASSSESILHINLSGFSGAGTYDGYTRIGILFIPTTSRANYYLSNELVQCIQEDPDDLRNNWIGFVKSGSKIYYYPYKYKNFDSPSLADDYEYHVLFRLTEQYLIRAEANVHLNQLEKAKDDIGKIRSRAGLSDEIFAGDLNSILQLIEDERRKEFFMECGHRWFDLNRTGRADAVYSNVSYKKYWQSYKSLLPIPETEIGRNSALVQNPGY